MGREPRTLQNPLAFFFFSYIGSLFAGRIIIYKEAKMYKEEARRVFEIVGMPS